MRQVLQNLKTGRTEVVEVPRPAVAAGHVLIQTRCSLVSAGTERMLVEFGKSGYIQKARQQPEKVRQVLDKVRTDGLLPTLDAIRSKLDQPLPLGYCNVGTVVQAQGARHTAHGIKEGDRVVSNGPHAEFVCVPANLCAGVPEGVSDEEAAFTVLGAIGLQGVRLAQPTLGECFVVTGLGLIGLLTVQILLAHGCRVLGFDLDRGKVELARGFGAEAMDLSAGADPVRAALAFSRGRGADGVLVTAATKSSEPVHQAARMCRKRGRIVLVGVTGLELNRADFYEKELSFQVSCSYGPGRYDPEYEDKGHDYPTGYVRWTEQRNFEAVLDLMAAGKLDVRPLITHRFPVDQAPGAYDLISENKEPYIGIILEYDPQISQITQIEGTSQLNSVGRGSEADPQVTDSRTLRLKASQLTADNQPHTPVVSFIGAGNYAKAVLIPAFKAAGARLRYVASNGGVSGLHAGRKFGFEETTTDVERIFSDPEAAVVVITTRHDSHASFVLKALEAGKHVFVEKPLCRTLDELDQIVTLRNSNLQSPSSPILMVGFNRRFSPLVQKMKALLAGVPGTRAFVMTVNAGAIPAEHWTQDPDVGGGRIIGEACHFIDLLRFLAGSPIVFHSRSAMDSEKGDTVTLQLRFGEGSIGTVHYFANGSKSFPKERLEVFAGGRVLQLDNFRTLRGFGWPGFKRMRLWRQDKGQRACAAAFLDALDRSEAVIPFEELIEVHRVAINLAQS